MSRKRTAEDDAPRVAFSPREVSRITREFMAQMKVADRTGVVYQQTKAGQTFELRYNPVKKLVWWRLCIDRIWQEGEDATVFDSLIAIANKISNKAYDRRMAKLQEQLQPVS